MKKEMILCGFVWIFTSQLFNICAALQWNLFEVTDSLLGDSLDTLNQEKWHTYVSLTVRSILMIGISTIKSLYDSYHVDQLVPIPPDEDVIQHFETTLHIPKAIESFHDYLACDERRQNSYRLLALYMDLRYFDNEL